MGFEPDDAIHHLRPDRLQPLGLVDVGLFVEARLELDHRRDFLAPAHRLAQQVGHFALAAGAVDGLLDGQHLRVFDRLAQKRQHGVEALVGLVDQHIAFFEALEKGLPRHQLRWPARQIGLEAQSRQLQQIDQLRHAHQVHRPGYAKQALGRQVELLQQKIRQKFGAPGRDLEPQRLPVVAARQAQAHGCAQVFYLFFVDRQIGVARDAKLRKLGHAAAREQIAQMRADQTGNGDETRRFAVARTRHAQITRQRTRHLDDGHFVFAPKGIAPSQAHDEIERFVGHLRKRMRGVEPDRQQQRLHLGGEVFLDPTPLRRGALAVRHDFDAALFQRWQQLLVVERILLRHQLVHLGRHLVEGLRIDGSALLVADKCRQLGRKTHLEKLIQIGRHDGQVAQPLQQGHGRATGPVEYALIEGQNALIAV